MSWWHYLLFFAAWLAVSIGVVWITGRVFDTMGADDRDESKPTKPTDIWQGHERRKVRAGTTTPR